jgi:hypothetical protein
MTKAVPKDPFESDSDEMIAPIQMKKTEIKDPYDSDSKEEAVEEEVP